MDNNEITCTICSYRIFLWEWMKNRHISVPESLLSTGSARKIWNYL